MRREGRRSRAVALADGTAHDALVSGDLALDPFEATDASEWMNDGYWEEEA